MTKFPVSVQRTLCSNLCTVNDHFQEIRVSKKGSNPRKAEIQYLLLKERIEDSEHFTPVNLTFTP